MIMNRKHQQPFKLQHNFIHFRTLIMTIHKTSFLYHSLLFFCITSLQYTDAFSQQPFLSSSPLKGHFEVRRKNNHCFFSTSEKVTSAAQGQFNADSKEKQQYDGDRSTESKRKLGAISMNVNGMFGPSQSKYVHYCIVT